MNILIVESKNDRHFVEALIRHLHLQPSVAVNPVPICEIDDFECMNGLSLSRLVTSLSSLLNRARREGVDKIGILIDLDNEGMENRLKLVNDAIRQACLDLFDVNFVDDIKNVSELSTITVDPSTSIQIACYFTNVDNKGELETVLKTIKTQDSPFADCLSEWQNCLKASGKDISQKEFDKFWLSNYVRFDTCSRNDKKQAERKCSIQNLDYVFENKTAIFDFEHVLLDDVKNFLRLFN
jgi:hypothetical protein